MTLNFATFASSNWTESPRRFNAQLDTIEKRFGLFKQSFIFNELDLSKEYLKRFSPYFSDHGFAYFSWKPVVLLEALSRIEDGELLFYIDGGCTFPMDRLDQFILELKNEADLFSTTDAFIGLTSFQEKPFKELPGFPNATIVKKEILAKFSLVGNQQFLYFYPHWQAGLVLCRKDNATIDFLKEWSRFFFDNYESCVRGGYHDKTGQDPIFIQNGSDQAILQCMLFTKSAKIFSIDFIHKYNMIQHIRR